MSSYKTFLNGVRAAISLAFNKVSQRLARFEETAAQKYNELAYVPIYETPLEDFFAAVLETDRIVAGSGFPALEVGKEYLVTIGYAQYKSVARYVKFDETAVACIGNDILMPGGDPYRVVTADGGGVVNVFETEVGKTMTIQLIGKPVEVGKEWLHDYVDGQNQTVAKAVQAAQGAANDAISLWDNVVIDYSSTAITSAPKPISIGIFPNSKGIQQLAFIGRRNLKTVYIPAATYIGNNAFQDCTGLKSIDIPSGMHTIGSYAFSGCSGISRITVSAENTIFHSQGNCLIDTANKCLIVGCKESIIPDDGSVTNFYTGAFRNNTELSDIVIPMNIVDTSSETFYGCSNLATIVYTGTMEQWNAVTKGSRWHEGVPATEVVCSDGSVPLTTET